MRLINAEHLKKRAADLDDDCWDYYGQSTADFLVYIDNEPTVDAVPVSFLEKLHDNAQNEEAALMIDEIIAQWRNEKDDF